MKQLYDLNISSEFSSNGYIKTTLAKRLEHDFKKGADHSDLLDSQLFKVSEDFQKIPMKKNTNSLYTCLTPFVNAGNLFSFQSDEKPIETSKLIRSFTEAVQNFSLALDSSADEETKVGLAQKMVKAFQKLSAKAVFMPENRMLANIYFRRECNFLNYLIRPLELPKIPHLTSYCGELNYHIYDLRDPFVCSSVLYIMQQYKKYQAQINTSVLSSLRQAIFIQRAEREFYRFMCAHRNTYRVSLNRQTNALIACPYNQSSSLETVKPLRLYEKICLYIKNRIENLERNSKKEKIKINVCVIGHTIPVYNPSTQKYDEPEMCDLGNAIYAWLENQRNLENIEVNISNLYNQYDITRVFWEEKDLQKQFVIGTEEKLVNIQIEKTDYELFNYNTQYFTDYIMENYDIIFVVECPFLTEENFDIKRDYSLKDYCNAVQSPRYFSNQQWSNLDQEKKSNPMTTLNAQYNRIMASNTRDAGEICRVFRDYWIRAIQEKMNHYQNQTTKKEIYIFTSEKDGVAYSTIASNPVSRIEQYGGKNFNIFRFANYKALSLPYKNKTERLRLKFRLWQIFKYACTEYAFNDFKIMIDKCFFGENPENKKCFERPIDYFTLYNNIYIILEEKEAYKNHHKFKLKASLYVDTDELCDMMARNQLEDVHKIEETLSQQLNVLFKTLFEEVYFSKTTVFGNEILRKAFSMNIYGSAQDVFGMWFWHKYRMACEENRFDLFDIEYQHTDICLIQNTKQDCQDVNKIGFLKEIHNDFFMDKKLYDIVMRSLEVTASVDFGMKALFYKSNEYYNVEYETTLRLILSNILKISDEMIMEQDDFRKNCRTLLREIC